MRKAGKSEKANEVNHGRVLKILVSLFSLFWPQVYGLTTKPMSHHLTKMKTILAFVVSILLAGIFFCQGQDATNSGPETASETNAGPTTPSFDGDWHGTVKSVAGSETNVQFRVRIVVKGDTALTYYREKNKWAEGAYEATGSVKYTISKMRDLYVITWLNQYTEGVWTEEQTYSLSYINPSKIRLVLLRHVCNRDEGKNGTSWFYVCVGILNKTN